DPNNLHTFTFSKGASSQLPGFTIAVTPDLNAFFDDVFDYVDGVGPVLKSGANATLFSGVAIAEGQSDGAGTPEPASWLLMVAAGVVLLPILVRRRVSV